ncbi:hypothetical protein FD754_005507, partial [Muntiacus muntjak]
LRPWDFLGNKIDLHTKCVVDVDANKVILNPVNTNLSKGDIWPLFLWEVVIFDSF